jgi:hypothetical protein
VWQPQQIALAVPAQQGQGQASTAAPLPDLNAALLASMLQQLQSVMLFKAAGADVLASYKEKYGFHPRVGSSLVEGGGWGVFMQGTAAAGSMVAVYPGLIIRDMRSVDELTYGAVSSALPHRKHVTLWAGIAACCCAPPAA